ncbi:MAG: NAD-dependent epimerase/dehydratase family protein [Steroidobacter sp.]
MTTFDSELGDFSADTRLLVTGASGFIGSRLALHAHRLGLDVLATGRADMEAEQDRLKELRAAKVPVEIGMLQDVDFVRRIVSGRSAVIHLAAAQHESEMPDSYFRSVNVDAVRLLLAACKDSGVRRFVYGSTMGVYGSARAGVLDEDTPPAPDNIYTCTKLEAEALVRSCADDFEVCVARIAETYGPGDQRLLKLFRGLDRGRFLMIGRGENLRQCIHVHDLIRGLLLVARHPEAAGQTFVLAGQKAMTTNEMVQGIAAALDRAPPLVRLPLWPFAIASRIMEAILPPLRIQPPLHSRRLDFFRKSFSFSIAKAQTLLGFQPEIDFRAGAADTVRWYRAHGLLTSSPRAEIARTESV